MMSAVQHVLDRLERVAREEVGQYGFTVPRAILLEGGDFDLITLAPDPPASAAAEDAWVAARMDSRHELAQALARANRAGAIAVTMCMSPLREPIDGIAAHAVVIGVWHLLPDLPGYEQIEPLRTLPIALIGNRPTVVACSPLSTH